MQHQLWPLEDAPGWSGLWASRLIETVRLCLPAQKAPWLHTQAWRLDAQQACAAVDMARGVLVHRVQVSEGQVQSAMLWAPTDWNAAPQGPLAQSLYTAWQTPEGQASTAAASAQTRHAPQVLLALWAAACDPCVPVRMGHDAHGQEVRHA